MIFSIIFAALIAVVTARSTPTGFIHIGRIEPDGNGIMQSGKDLYLSVATGTHGQAQYDCKTVFGGQLAFLLTRNHDEALKMFLALPGNAFTVHIGGSRIGNGSPWYWTSGVTNIPVTYFNWRAGQPNNAYHCICAGGIGQSYGWQSCTCDQAYRYVCEV